MKNFIQRAITGLIFVAVLIGCIVGGPLSFGLLFCLISALATAEFCNLMNRKVSRLTATFVYWVVPHCFSVSSIME